jgi:hypothetical protein
VLNLSAVLNIRGAQLSVARDLSPVCSS